MLRRWPLPFFNADAGSGGGGADQAAGAAAGDAAAAAAAAADGGGAASGGDAGGSAAAAPVRPDWLPETAWDATAGKPTVDVAELLTLKQQHDERAGQVPQDPAGYKVELPEGFTLPDGVKFEVADNDPLLAEARAVAKEMGLTQAQFSKIMGLRAKMDVQAHEAWNATLAAERVKLGDKAVERIDAATSFLQSKLPVEQFQALRGAVTTAAGVEAVETLMTLVGGPKLPGGGPVASEAVSEVDYFKSLFKS